MIYAFVLACMLLLAGDRDHKRLAGAIATAVDEAPPLFRDDADKRKTSALLVAVAFREGSLRESVTGDKGRSFCTFQIHATSGGSSALNDDPLACARKGRDMLRESFRVCPEHPVAWYAEGPTGCTSDRAQRISRDRMNLAKWVASHAKP